MIRFDWRRHEPSDQRDADWPNLTTSDLLDRYRDTIQDVSPWQALVGRLRELPPQPHAIQIRCVQELDRFLEDIPKAIVRPPKPCIFISHQRSDANNGVRIACLADHHGLDSWLDVHDPTLALANQLPSGDPRRSVLIAAIIEIALLSSTHVIALHTANSTSSRWVPYELGRAKARKIASVQAAGWLQRGQTVATCGDYVQLAVITRDESEIAAWLQTVAIGGSFWVPVSIDCPVHGTTELT
jgi:hypothetical protein